MSPENAHKLIRIYMGGLILGVNTLYMLSCFLQQFALVGKGLIDYCIQDICVKRYHGIIIIFVAVSKCCCYVYPL